MEATFTSFTSNGERTERTWRKSQVTAQRPAMMFKVSIKWIAFNSFIVAATRIWLNQLAQYQIQTIFNYNFNLFQFLAKNSNSL